MSPTVNNFVHDLVAMAKAMEDLPVVQAELDKANGRIEAYAKQVQEREISILHLKDELTKANETIRKVEVERDNAETMFLELDQKAHQVLAFLTDIQGNATSAAMILDPPKPEPIPEPSVEQAVTHHESVAGPSSASTLAPAEPGVSVESLPHTAPIAPVQSDNVGGHVHSSGVPSTENVSPSETTGSSSTYEDSWAGKPAEPPVFDDVGYHNEPNVADNNWDAWDAWASRMNARYGSTTWPQRTRSF